MKIRIVIIALVVLIVGAIYSQYKNSNQVSGVKVETEEVGSDNDPSNEAEEDKVTPSPSPVTQTAAPTPIVESTKTTTPTTSPTSDLVYPNSVTVSESSGQKTLETDDDVEVVTNWYEERLKSLDMNVNSFVKTNTNDKVLNKLSVADGVDNIAVEISKDSGSTKVTIKITQNQ